MNANIQQALTRLVGLDWIATGRTAALQHFTFGKHELRVDQESRLAEFALHVTCPWRVKKSGRLLVGCADYWRPSSDAVDDDEYEDGKVGSRLRDVRNDALRVLLAAGTCRVLQVIADDAAGFVVTMESDIVLEVFPDASHSDHHEVEFWRLFQPGVDTAHFVVSSNGIDRVAED